MRRLIIVLLLLSVSLVSCQKPSTNFQINETKNFSAVNMSQNITTINNTNIVQQPTIPAEKSIMVFDLESFDELKIGNQQIMNQIKRLVSKYDIVLLQGVKLKKPLMLERALNNIKSEVNYYKINDNQYFFSASNEPLNAEIINTTLFTNKPLLMKTNFDAEELNFVFIKINETNAQAENNNLGRLVNLLQSNYNVTEESLVLMGDFKDDCYYADAIFPKNFFSLINQDTIVTINACTYDRIIVSDDKKIFCESGIDYYDLEEKISYELASKVSLHYPIYLKLCNYK